MDQCDEISKSLNKAAVAGCQSLETLTLPLRGGTEADVGLSLVRPSRMLSF